MDTNKITHGIIIIGIISIVLAVLIIIIGLLIVLKRYSGQGFFSKPSSVWIINILAFITAVMVIVVSIICYMEYDKSGSVAFKTAIKNNCIIASYMAPTKYIDKYTDGLWDSVFPYGLVAFISSIVYLLISFFAFIIRACKKLSPCSPI